MLIIISINSLYMNLNFIYFSTLSLVKFLLYLQFYIFGKKVWDYFKIKGLFLGIMYIN